MNDSPNQPSQLAAWQQHLVTSPPRDPAHAQPHLLLILPQLTLGGSDKFNLDLVGGLTARGYHISICTTVPHDNPWRDYFAQFTPDIFCLADFSEAIDYPNFILHLINVRHIDVVFISHSNIGYGLLPFLRTHCPQLRLVDYNHMVDKGWKNGGHPFTSIRYQDLLDQQIVASQQIKQWMVAQGASAEKIAVCTINIDTTLWQPTQFDRVMLRHKLGLTAEIPVILHAGRIEPQKRPRFLAEILHNLTMEAAQPFVCLIAGAGSELAWLENFINEKGLSQYIRLLGSVSPSRMVELQAIADIFLLPSDYEGISLGIYEAMAMETVPVSAAVGGQSELVTLDCGYLIPQTATELAEYVQIIRNLLTSPELRQQIGRAARQRVVKHFDLSHMISRMATLLHPPLSPRLNQQTTLSLTLAHEHATQAIEVERLGAWVADIYRNSKQLFADQQQYITQLTHDHATAVAQLQATQTQLQQLTAEHQALKDYYEYQAKATPAMLNRLNSVELSQQISIRNMVQAIGHKIGDKWAALNPIVRFQIARAKRQEQLRHQQLRRLTPPASLDKLTVLWLYQDIGAPTRYRVRHQVAQLAAVGWQSKQLLMSDEASLEILLTVDLLYIYRAELTPLTKKLVELAHTLRIPVIFDTDDLIWDPQIETYCFLHRHWPAAEVAHFMAGVKRHAELMAMVDYFVVSTAYLADLIKETFTKPVFMNKNVIPPELPALSEPFYQTRLSQEPPQHVTIGYFSGWQRAHQEDFEVAVEALAQLLATRPQVRLTIVGYLEQDVRLTPFGERVQFKPYTEWSQLPALMSEIEINIAPIVNNPHRRSKSAVKFLEAALVGLPTVASDLEPYQDIKPGATGFLATDTASWYQCLIKLVDSPELRRGMGQAAREQVLAQDTMLARQAHFQQTLTGIIYDYYK